MLIFSLFLSYIPAQVHYYSTMSFIVEAVCSVWSWNKCQNSCKEPLEWPCVFKEAHTISSGGRGWCAASWITSGNLLSQPCVLVNREGLTFNPPTTICFIIYLRESESFCSFTKVPDTKIFLIAEIFHSCHNSFWKYRYFHTTRS